MFGCDELVSELLLRSFLFSSLWVLAVPSVLWSLVLGEDSYNCLRDKSSSVPPNSFPRSMLFRLMCADLCLCTPCACGNVSLHSQWIRGVMFEFYPRTTAVVR